MEQTLVVGLGSWQDRTPYRTRVSMRHEPEYLEEDTDRDNRPRRRHHPKAWSAWVVVAMILLTILIPLLGIILGIIDMANEGPRRVQGAAFLALGLVMCLVYAVAYLG